MKLAAVLSTIALMALVVPASASASNGSYTQVLCFNPDTGQAVGAPEEFAVTQSGQAFSKVVDCQGDVGASKGISLTSGLPNHANDAQSYELTYSIPTDLKLRGGDIYRYWKAPRVNPGFQVINLHGGTSGNFFVDPFAEHINWYLSTVLGQYPWVSRGDPVTAFSGQNHVSLVVGGQNFWRLTLGCDSGEYDVGCTLDPAEQVFRIFGGKMRLDDESAPVPSSPASGSLANDATVSGQSDVSVTATDIGSGLYRMIVLVDGAELKSQEIDVNGGRCSDVNPANQDPYEFALAVPCKKAASATTAIDTRALSDGNHNIKVQIEDAGGNRTTIVNRSVRVANNPALSEGTAAIAATPSGPLRLSFRVSKRRLRNGQVLRYLGQLVGQNAARKFVDVQVRKGRSWQVVCSVQTGPQGTYACRHRFTRTKTRTRYIFRARVREQAELLSRTITTRSLSVVVRP